MDFELAVNTVLKDFEDAEIRFALIGGLLSLVPTVATLKTAHG